MKKPTLKTIYADDDFKEFFIRIAKSQDIKNIYLIYKSIRLPYMDTESVVKMAKNMIAGNELMQRWNEEDDKPWKKNG